jgi:hypothetical protein
MLVAMGASPATNNEKALYIRLKNRLPTSYNVFDSSFNNIDNSGNWTLKAKEIYGDNLLVNSNVDISGELLLFNTDLSGNITTSIANHNANIKATNNTTETTTFLKVKINGADAWIPYFTTDPSAP